MAEELDTKLEPQSLQVTPVGLMHLEGYDKTRVDNFGYMLNAVGRLIAQRMSGRTPAMVWTNERWTVVSAENADVANALTETRAMRKVNIRAASELSS